MSDAALARPILNLIRFPLACIGQAVDIFWQMRAHNRMVAALNEIQPEPFAPEVEKSDYEYCPSDCNVEEGWHISPDGKFYVIHGYAGPLPTPDDTVTFTTDPATDAAVADSSRADPPVGDERPSSPNPPGAAGSHHELVQLIVEVLDAHEGHWDRDAAMYECLERVDDADRGFRIVTVGDDYQGWLRHVAPLIAECIEKATPAAPFTFGDLAQAARIIRSYYSQHYAAYGMSDEAKAAFALSNRLADAADADPTP